MALFFPSIVLDIWKCATCCKGRCLWACHEEIIISVHFFCPLGQRDVIDLSRNSTNSLWLFVNNVKFRLGFLQNYMIVAPSIHFALTYPLPTDNHQELWKCCCSFWAHRQLEVSMSLCLAGAIVETQLMNREESHTVGYKGKLAFSFLFFLLSLFPFTLGWKNTYGCFFGIWGVLNNYGLIFLWFWCWQVVVT